jgi:hypothetical protein
VLHTLLVEPLAQQADAVAAPEQLADDDEGRHAEHARRLGLTAQAVVLDAALARQERREARRAPASTSSAVTASTFSGSSSRRQKRSKARSL